MSETWIANVIFPITIVTTKSPTASAEDIAVALNSVAVAGVAFGILALAFVGAAISVGITVGRKLCQKKFGNLNFISSFGSRDGVSSDSTSRRGSTATTSSFTTATTSSTETGY